MLTFSPDSAECLAWSTWLCRVAFSARSSRASFSSCPFRTCNSPAMSSEFRVTPSLPCAARNFAFSHDCALKHCRKLYSASYEMKQGVR